MLSSLQCQPRRVTRSTKNPVMNSVLRTHLLSVSFLFHPVKRDTPSSLSNLHHQTANASTNTPIHESLCLSPFYTTAIGSKSPSAELSVGSTMRLASVPSSSTASLNSSHVTTKLTKISSNLNPPDHSSFNFISRSETNQEPLVNNEKKLLIVR